MGQVTSLYGLLVPFNSENDSDIQSEESIMKETKRKMIEEAAYFLAEKRGFKHGYELEDWLQAEAQINNVPE